MYWNRIVLSLFIVLLLGSGASGQLLNKVITVGPNRHTIQNLLEIISNQGNFYFSYNSGAIPKDSIIQYPGGTRTVRSALDIIFSSGFEYRETGNYIIIRRAPLQISLITQQQASNDNNYTVSGYVRDDQTGERIPDASVYEKIRLASALTNEDGFFKIKLKARYKQAALTVSKEFYEDTTVRINPGFNQQLSITLQPAEFSGANVIVGPGRSTPPDSLYISVPQPDSSSILYLYKKMDSIRVQRTALGKFLLSSRLKMQSINLGKFFTVRPIQFSLLPGLSSNGKLNPQVVNNFSFNVLGGYSGGVNGFEIGGLFNIDKKEVKYVQIAGLVNLVGGSMEGVQIGGLVNSVLDKGNGVQVGGLVNFNRGSYTGLQIGGISSAVLKSGSGMQLSGISNFVRDSFTGLQLAGIVNYTKKLKGVQIGLINISDTSEGYSIGLINIVLKGYHKLAFYNTEFTQFNAAFKTGNHKLYSILLGGVNPDTSKRVVSFGYGIGSEFSFNKTVGLNAELSSQYVYLGSWENLNLWNRASVNFRVKIWKFLAVYAGPAFSVLYSDQQQRLQGWQFPLPSTSYKTYSWSKEWSGWLGWTAGVHIF